jgi:hypothetical protein
MPSSSISPCRWTCSWLSCWAAPAHYGARRSASGGWEILQEALHEFLAVRLLVCGLLLVGLIVFLPDGLAGRLGQLAAVRGRRRGLDGVPAM